MIGRAKQAAWVLLVIAGLAAGIVIVPRLESQRSLRLLKEEGAVFDFGEDGAVRWMTLPPEETTDATLRLLRNNSDVLHLTLSDCTITDEGLRNLGTLENLTKLDLSGTRFVEDAFPHLRGSTALRELSLAECPWLTDQKLAAVTGLPELRFLNLRDTSVSDACVDHLLRLEHLVHLDLTNCPHVTEAGIRRLIELPNLASLNIPGTSISVAFWKELPTARPGLKINARIEMLPEFAPLMEAGGTFYESGIGFEVRHRVTTSFSIDGPVEPDALALLGELEWRMSGLSICNCPLEDADLEWLSRLSALESLNLSGTNVSESTVAIVSRCPLRYVNLSGTPVTDRALDHLAGVSTLEWLHLSRTGIRGDGFARFTEMDNLRYVELSGSTLNDDGAAHLARLPALETLRLADTALTDEGLASLGEAPALEYLVVDGTAIRGEGLEGLSRSTTIRYLYLNCEQLSDESLRHLAAFPSLSSLSLAGSHIGDSGVQHVSQVAGLERLSIPGTHLTPAIAPALERMTRLQSLTLRGAVCDELLASLAAVAGLEWLNLSQADFHEEALTALEAARPELSIWK